MFWIGHVRGSQRFQRIRHRMTWLETGRFTWQRRQEASRIQECALTGNQQGKRDQSTTAAWIWIPPSRRLLKASLSLIKTMRALNLAKMLFQPYHTLNKTQLCHVDLTPKPQAENAEPPLLLNSDEKVKSCVQDYPWWQRPTEKALAWDTGLS